MGKPIGLALWDSQTIHLSGCAMTHGKRGNMNAYKIKYEDGTYEVVIAKNSLEVIKKYDLATKEHINTRIIELEGEQKAIAIANWKEQF